MIAFCVLFVMIEIVMGCLLHLSSGRAVEFYSMCSILFCALFFVLFFERSHDYFLMQIALLCTLGADYCLVWLKPYRQLPAMCLFLIVQFSYFLRLYWSDDNQLRKKWNLILRGAFSVAILIVTIAVLRDKTDALALISMLYYVNLLLNIVFSFVMWKKNPIFALGLFFFILCDTLVGLSVLGEYFVIAENSVLYRIIYPGFNLAWAFYLPSQVLLTLSLLPKRLRAAT